MNILTLLFHATSESFSACPTIALCQGVLRQPASRTATLILLATELTDQEAIQSVEHFWDLSGGMCTGFLPSVSREAGSCQRRCHGEDYLFVECGQLHQGKDQVCSFSAIYSISWVELGTQEALTRVMDGWSIHGWMNGWVGGFAQRMLFLRDSCRFFSFFLKHEITCQSVWCEAGESHLLKSHKIS